MAQQNMLRFWIWALPVHFLAVIIWAVWLANENSLAVLRSIPAVGLVSILISVLAHWVVVGLVMLCITKSYQWLTK